MKHLFRLASLLGLALCSSIAGAQFIGYTAPQTTQQVLATNSTCTGSAQLFPLKNLGQLQHWLSVGSVVGAQSFQAEIDGIDRQGNVYRISDVLESANVGGGIFPETLFATGYFPQIQAKVTCAPNTATFSMSYSGGWGASNTNSTGSYLISQIDKVNFNGLPANVGQADQFSSPFGSSAGTLFFQYSGGSIAGSALSVGCTGNSGASVNEAFRVTPQAVLGTQTFQVPDVGCPLVQVNYQSGGATAATIFVEYVFAVPGIPFHSAQLNIYSHITGATALDIKSTPGVLHTVTINSPGAATMSLFDLPLSACAATPSTNVIAVITNTGTSAPVTLHYDLQFLQGLCVKLSAAAGDWTVTAQ